jgi:hypothetical protein
MRKLRTLVSATAVVLGPAALVVIETAGYWHT